MVTLEKFVVAPNLMTVNKNNYVVSQ